MFIDRYLDHGVKIDFWWMDAGWYENKTGWPNVGTWEVDRKRFPHGLRAVTDHAHARGVNALLWFEPSESRRGPGSTRTTRGCWARRPAEALLLRHSRAAVDGRSGLKLMKDEGIDIYRQDFNFPPLNYWRNNDTPDRKGITEIRHCVGYLAYWDELRRRNPNMLTDECASGGRRNDLESMRRAVPLHKSDMNYGDLEAKHTQFYGLALWHPYFATGSGLGDAYSARTAFAPMLVLGCDMRREDLDLARMVQAELDRTAVRAAGGRTPRFRRCDTPFGRVHAVAADHNVPVVEQGHPGTTVLPVGDVLQLVVGLIERERSPSTGTSCGMSIANDTALAPSVFTSAATVYRWPASRRMSGFCQAAAVTTSGLALPSSSMVFLPS